MRCLLVTKEFSATPTSGGMLRTLALLEQLATRYDTTVISPAGVSTQGPGRPLSELPPTRRPADGEAGQPSRRDQLERLRTFGRYRSISGMRTAGPQLLANLRRAHGHYDVAIIDHTCLAGLADDVAIGCDRLIVSMHNLESDLMAQRATPGFHPAMRVETFLLRRLEARIATRYPLVVCTAADAAALKPGGTTIVCRNGIFATADAPADTPAATSANERPAERDDPASSMVFSGMVFSGALDWEPNVAGLLWFVQQVWPLVRQRIPAAAVTIAGRRPTSALVEACRLPGIRIVADPPVMADVLAGHGLGIVPLLNGGGSRIKILEYLAAGLDIVSTDVGASGLEDVPAELLTRVPADPATFAEQVITRLATPRGSGRPAQDWVREHYSWNVTWAPLLDHLHA